jgi:hypothetical protein
MAPPPTPPRVAAAPLALLAGATLALGTLQAWPREGQPLLLLFPPGGTQNAALLGVLAVPGWDPVTLRRLGPFAAVIAARADPEASGAALRRMSGAWLSLPALGWGGCDNRRSADTPFPA